MVGLNGIVERRWMGALAKHIRVIGGRPQHQPYNLCTEPIQDTSRSREWLTDSLESEIAIRISGFDLSHIVDSWHPDPPAARQAGHVAELPRDAFDSRFGQTGVHQRESHQPGTLSRSGGQGPKFRTVDGR